MKIASYLFQGDTSFGVVQEDGIVDAKSRLGGGYADVRAVVEAGALDELAATTDNLSPEIALSAVTFLPPIRPSESILVVGRNFGTAFQEMDSDFVGYPSIFMRRNSSQVGHDVPMVRPAASHNFDCEAELALVIGKTGRHIPESEALAHIAGYSIFNDSSIPDWMDHTSRNVTPGKNFEASGSFGPWIVTADEINDPANLRIQQRINGETIQDGSTKDMIFSIPAIIAYLSTFTTLRAGDVISTGSPGGVRPRRDAGIFLKPGDVMEMEIDGIGILRNGVTDE
ncbi:MAG: fumarylacetoacetate hydrolase family protein [Proteobacteria bacterium]|nr:fumarylacetoacetate hydrolase family protein [Pseudomonadota bacterium]